MLKSLLIKNFILIDEALLNFKKGFNVLCGETGAGKSIIIKALDCVLGAKVSKEMILDSMKPAYIEAVFETDNEEFVVSREISSTSKFRINGMMSNLDEIKEKRESLVDIHSQHQTYTYIQQKNHIILLDNYILKKFPEFKELVNAYKTTFIEYKEVEKRLEALRQNKSDNEKEIEFLKFQLKELDDASIRENEEDELKSELNILSNVQELKEGTYGAYYALYGDSQSIVEALSKIKYEISSCSELDKNLKEAENTLFDAFENLKDCANFLRDYSSNLELNPNRIDELNERISLIQKLKRKYGENLDFEREQIAKKLNELDNPENNIEQLEEKYNTLFSSVELLANRIRDYRKNSALELSKKVVENLKELQLKDARFEISVEEKGLSETGKDNVEFLISTNVNQNLMPLIKVASGGEISRVMLALKTIFATVDKISTVVFDEIDTGISGITSNSVASAILELSKLSQIICITHQPIICAKADNFIWISKINDEKTTISTKILDDNERLEALAQLASGEVTKETIDFAKTLVK